MVKSKDRKILGLTAVSNSNFDLDLLGDDNWVIVKKQKVTVLVPPPPAPKLLHGSDPEKIQPQIQTFPANIRSKTPPRTVLARKKGTQLSRQAPPLQDRRIKSQIGVGFCYACKFMEQSMNPRVRALNLERKLEKAGGLSRWLASLGLHQFVKIFQRKSISKFHLVNMSMKKLKDMGATAVGPRRKLMHAIDCICQPCCFSSNASKA